MYFCLRFKNMLQRIQTLYLFIAAIISGGIIFFAPLWENVGGNEFYILDLIKEMDWKLISISIAFFLSAILSIISLILFKNRKQQIKMNRFNLVVNLYLLGIIVYHVLTLSGENQISVKGIGLFLPVLVIVFLVLANKATQKDEALVKSVDRLR